MTLSRIFNALVFITRSLVTLSVIVSVATLASAAQSGGLQVSSGATLLQGTQPRQAYVHRVAKEICPDGIEARVQYFDPRVAVQTREKCREIVPNTLVPKSFNVPDGHADVLLLNTKLFDRETPPGISTLVLCMEGKDSVGRPVITQVKRNSASGSLSAFLTVKGSVNLETFEFAVTSTTRGQMTAYQAGRAGQAPYFDLALGNFNGLTAFLSYDVNTQAPGAGRIGTNRKEANLNLPHCFSP